MRYHILKDFRGSQTGSTVEDFTAGTEAELSDYLASCVDPAWIRPVDAVSPAPTFEVDNKAITTDGKKPRTRKAAA